MQISFWIGIASLHKFLETFDETELHRDLRTDAEKWEEHALIKREKSFLLYGFLEGMNVSLIVLLRFRNNLDLDVLERQHTDHLSPSAHASAKQILCYFERTRHLSNNAIKIITIYHNQHIHSQIVLRLITNISNHCQSKDEHHLFESDPPTIVTNRYPYVAGPFLSSFI